ncbi:hypothetical protein JVU11DRAFT_4041 [Chiua virens]|nr:hypothetical protein JVU11DRAFT_4041 [Chiua virens]
MFHHWSPSRAPTRNDYPDDDDAYYNPSNTYSRPPPPQQTNLNGSSRRRQNHIPQDTGSFHVYHRHRDDWDSRSQPSFRGVRPLQRRVTGQNTEYASAPVVGEAAPRAGIRSKSTSPPGRRHATPLPTAPSIPQLSLSERETLARQRIQTTFETYVFNTVPTHLLRIADMTLVTRNEIWETFKPRIESLSDSHLATLVLEQDEEARKLGISVTDPEVLAPFVSSWCFPCSSGMLTSPAKTEHIRSMISFAVFSHRWGIGEVQFYDLPNKRFQVSRRSPPNGAGYQKLVKFCEKARSEYGCEYVWADTCCINKESSTELEEAILSMGLWYSEAVVCIAHLGDSAVLEDFVSEPWFTRLWTLQELLLPRKIRFYGKDWSPICPVPVEGRREERTVKDNRDRDEQRVNDKENESAIATITRVTGIPETDIRNFVPSCTRVAEKMRWASKRTTSKTEDMAYSLLGLFDVIMPIAYGEGARAFYKLMSTIAEQCTEPDLFAWGGKPSQWSLALPSSPQCYAPQTSQSDLVLPSTTLGDPAYELTKLGLQVRLVLVPAYCELLEQTDIHMARMLLTPALATAQESIQIYVSLFSVVQNAYGSSRSYDHDHREDPREREMQAGRGREYALGVVDYDARAGPPGYAALHAGRQHLCLVLERDRRGRGWVRVARPGALGVRFRERELLPTEVVCLLHRA